MLAEHATRTRIRSHLFNIASEPDLLHRSDHRSQPPGAWQRSRPETYAALWLRHRRRRPRPGLPRYENRRGRCSCRARTSRSPPALENIVDTATSANSGEACRELFAECHEVECPARSVLPATGCRASCRNRLSPLCGLKREFCTRFHEPHNGLGRAQRGPPERSGAQGSPRAEAKGGPRGRSPPDLVRLGTLPGRDPPGRHLSLLAGPTPTSLRCGARRLALLGRAAGATYLTYPPYLTVSCHCL
jgi:hypothetical protein